MKKTNRFLLLLCLSAVVVPMFTMDFIGDYELLLYELRAGRQGPEVLQKVERMICLLVAAAGGHMVQKSQV